MDIDFDVLTETVKNHWGQGQTYEPVAGTYCLIGAGMKAIGIDYAITPRNARGREFVDLEDKVAEKLFPVIREVYPNFKPYGRDPWFGVSDFNDNRATTEEDALRVVEELRKRS